MGLQQDEEENTLAEGWIERYHLNNCTASLWRLSWDHELGDLFGRLLIIFEGWVWTAPGHEWVTDLTFKMYAFHHCGYLHIEYVCPSFFSYYPLWLVLLHYYKENWEPIKSVLLWLMWRESDGSHASETTDRERGAGVFSLWRQSSFRMTHYQLYVLHFYCVWKWHDVSTYHN